MSHGRFPNRGAVLALGLLLLACSAAAQQLVGASPANGGSACGFVNATGLDSGAVLIDGSSLNGLTANCSLSIGAAGAETVLYDVVLDSDPGYSYVWISGECSFWSCVFLFGHPDLIWTTERS